MMKKLFVLGVAAVSGAACAQSSVTIFGIADAGVSHGRGSLSHITQLSRNGYGSNRLGFRGVEDLRGGVSVGFWLEAGFNIDEGSGQATNTDNQASGASGGGGLTFNRRSTLQLTGPWGEVRLGRDYNPHYRSFTEMTRSA